MAKNQIYLAIGEEGTRGTKEVTTVGFVPSLSPFIPAMEFDDQKRTEFRGEDSAKGDTLVTRYSKKWSGSLEMPMFTEAGTTAGIIGTLLKHHFGYVVSAQNAATSQYYHMMSPTDDPFATANLSTKALSFNVNINEGATMKNWPFVGGRVAALTFDQETGGPLKVTADLFGQQRAATTAEIGSPAYFAGLVHARTGGVQRLGVLHQQHSQLGAELGKERLEKTRRGDQEPGDYPGLLRDLPAH